jgi:signal peptidase I
MTKRKSSKQRERACLAAATVQAPSPRTGKNQPAGQAKSHMFSQAAIRETVESVVIAFVLAFLFRTFEAEAFVIPTGSMAPTLMGRHKDYECPVCGHWYQVSASEEIDQETNRSTGQYVLAGTCPMCRFTADLGRNNPQRKDYPAYDGDRILVGKFAYQFAEPQRWDVAVFKYPGHAVTNYIKRIVGLPGEMVVIRNGDIFINGPADPQRLEIARKPPDKLLAMLQLVFDNQYMPHLASYGFPSRWQPSVPGSAGQFEAVATSRRTARRPVKSGCITSTLCRRSTIGTRSDAMGSCPVTFSCSLNSFTTSRHTTQAVGATRNRCAPTCLAVIGWAIWRWNAPSRSFPKAARSSSSWSKAASVFRSGSTQPPVGRPSPSVACPTGGPPPRRECAVRARIGFVSPTVTTSCMFG